MDIKLPSNLNYQKIKIDAGMLRLAEAFKNFSVSTKDVADAFAKGMKNIPRNDIKDFK